MRLYIVTWLQNYQEQRPFKTFLRSGEEGESINTFYICKTETKQLLIRNASHFENEDMANIIEHY